VSDRPLEFWEEEGIAGRRDMTWYMWMPKGTEKIEIVLRAG